MRMMITNWSQRLKSQIVTGAKTRAQREREKEEAEGIAGSSSGREGGKRAELSLFMPPKEIENGREKSDAKSSCHPSFLPPSFIMQSTATP